jgi:hypothetical protein
MIDKHSLITTRAEVSSFALENAYSREDYENHIIQDLARQFAEFIVNERPELISVSEPVFREGNIMYELRAHVLTPEEFERLVQDEVMDRALSSILASKLMQQQEES